MRYLLFGGSTYYPQGGACDFLLASDTADELLQIVVERSKNNSSAKHMLPSRLDWWHIFDVTAQEIVFEK